MSTVNEKMIALADEIRTLSGTQDGMSLDDMTANVENANEVVNSQLSLLDYAITEIGKKAAGSGGSSGGGNFFVTEAALASDYATKTGKVLCNIPYIGEHINDSGLFVALIKKDTIGLTLSIPFVMACNTAWLNSSYTIAIQRTQYGMSAAYRGGGLDGYQLNNSSATDMPRVYADASGNVYILPYSNYSFVAGTYSVIYGIL